MSKLLDLKITTDELKSSQPPKPPPNAWEQFLPDSKVRDGMSLTQLDAVSNSIDDDKSIPEQSTEEPTAPRTEIRDPVPREVRLYTTKRI